ncbi:SWIM zinc finger family protein [Bifidobacterium callimiconis]|uniref:Zinc finger, SWIM domain-containing protein n=1 Tax=Bifidobacterium callimiconis TaxID=2306973 RepID=A0A430FGK6_9BIFI|nr:SWIM zinc finger family protein [Bifidobacterium callimiconis]RSX52035.1 zinc finger, SWIM domain-containing protein [Bifidobacterium callimiconis]
MTMMSEETSGADSVSVDGDGIDIGMSSADIDEFLKGHYYDLFKSYIYDRGRAYYDAGKVDVPEPIAKDLWHAVVRGNDDYQVDVRLQRGRVVSAACSCPYARHSAYCKHVAATLIAMAERLRRQRDQEQGIEPEFPRDASNMVRWYIGRQFSFSARLSDDDWRVIKHILETLYGFPDLETIFRKMKLDLLGSCEPGEAKRRRRSGQAATVTLTQQRNEALYRRRPTDKPERNLANMRILVPGFDVAHLDELPHTWMTILEAAYERLHDAEGLRRLYMYYIVIAQTDPEAVYVERLRAISGEHWAEDRDEIVRLQRTCRRFGMMSAVNPAYERLVREERLTDEAFDYCLTGGMDDIAIRLLDVLAQNPESLDRTLHYFRNVLKDPDSDVYKQDDAASAERVGRWIRKIDTVIGYDEACSLAEHIVGMFPQRKKLRECLADYVSEVEDPPEFDDDDWNDDDAADDDGDTDDVDKSDSEDEESAAGEDFGGGIRRW